MRTLIIRGARENNLRGIDLDLPLDALVVFTGRSGAGKSSLALDTLHAEGRRRYLEALSASVRGAARGLTAPDVDLVAGLPPTVALVQREAPPGPRSTAATTAEVAPVLHVLLARAGEQRCPGCGRPVRAWTHDEIVADLLSATEGTRLLLESPVPLRGEADLPAILDEVARAGFSRVRIDGRVARVEEVPAGTRPQALRVVVDRIRLSADKAQRLHDGLRTATRAGQGVVIAVVGEEERSYADRPWCTHCERLLPELRPSLLSHRGAGACPRCTGRGEVEGATCTACAGTRLREEARAVFFEGRTLPEWLSMGGSQLLEEARAWRSGPVVDVALGELRRRLEILADLGLGDLGLDRGASTLSRGELQRLRLGRQAGARLSGVLYLLDEPTTGLDRGAVVAAVGLLRRLVDHGNSLVVVSHHPELVRAADHVVDFGPGPGLEGGRIVYEGPPPGLLEAETPTGRWLSGRERIPVREPAEPSQTFAHGAHALPVGALVALVGPSGGGKSRLLASLADALGHGALPGVDRVVTLDQAVLRRTARSNPATYSGLWSHLRTLLASTRAALVRGLTPSHFSLNVKGGRCEHCKGSAQVRVDLDLLPDAWLRCPVCDGRRFTADVLQVRWRGMAPDEILALRAAEAAPLLAGHPRLDAPLRALVDVGLGYVPLGQPGHTLSGGEARRLRLARELIQGRGGRGTAYLLDDPGAGLHPADIAALVHLLRRLVDEGATVWLATHDAALAGACDERLLVDGDIGSP